MAKPRLKKKADGTTQLASNRRARREYEILETFEAGIVLAGTEVKSVREGKVQLKDSYVEIEDGEAFLVGTHISAYTHGNRENQLPERRRKLLLHKREIDKLFGRSISKGLTIVPLSLYLKGHLIKLQIGLARGRREFDKRESERARELDREARAAIGRRGFD